MSFLLCHECYCWVEPAGRRCPHCQHVVDVATADPPLTVLEEAIGNLDRMLGEIQVQRRMLPDRGLLYATENGLFFLPHHVQRDTRIKLTRDLDTPLLWSLGAVLCTPLGFMPPFFRRRSELHLDEALQPIQLSPDDNPSLPTLLMHNPGVFFVPRRVIQSCGRRFHRWRIERTQGSALKFAPIGSRSDFHSRMSTWFQES